jgi:hypothetical protein
MKVDKNRGARSNLLPLYLKNHTTGIVHSKFNKGLNVQFENSIIYISSIDTPLSAFGLNIEAQKLKQVLNSTSIHDLVVNKDEKLIFYSVDEIINVDYKGVEQVDLKLPKIKCSISEIPDSKLYNYLKKIKFEELIGIDLDDETFTYEDMLLSSNKWDLNINSVIINYFCGRGKGLTPSGDDILIGFTMAIMMFDKSYNWIRSLNLQMTNNKTTMISEAYLKALLKGYVSEYFIQLIKLIDEKDINKISNIIKKVQFFGHTSGNDTLFGFFLGLKFLINK